jgi:hypothetical protein
MNLLQTFYVLWFRFKRWLLRQPKPFQTFRVTELPQELSPIKVYLVGEGQYQWFVAVLCPCNCGDTLYLNLTPNSRPRWNLTQHDDDTVTLYPSVSRSVGCKSHFLLQRGLIKWI